MVLGWILSSTILISLIAFSGVLTLATRGRLSDRVLLTLVGFSAGALLGGAFLHLIPTAVKETTDPNVFNMLALSFVVFFLFERVI
jgi:zinc and cadmium transporter